MLNAAFFKASAVGLPLDGKIATRAGAARWISSAQSRRLVHELRGRVDAIVVGSGTVMRDNPLLTCREAERRRTATRVVLCGRRAPTPGSAIGRTARQAPVLLAYPRANPPRGLHALEEAGCSLLPLPAAAADPQRVDVRSVLKALAERGAANVLVEGGREVLGSFFDDGLVDRVMVFVAPFVIGGAEAVTAVGGRGVASIKEAVALLGGIVPADRDAPMPGPRTTVRLVGRDVLVDGWVCDPRKWVP